MTTVPDFIVIDVILGVLCAYYHKQKGYSYIAGFCWGFFFSVIGVAVVVLESTKAEHDASDKKEMKVWQWLLIFLIVGILSIFLFITMLSRPNNKKVKVQDTVTEINSRKLDINYTSDTEINNKFNKIGDLYYYIKDLNWKASTIVGNSKVYLNAKDNMYLDIECIELDEDEDNIENYMTDKFANILGKSLLESKTVNINGMQWNMYCYTDKTGYDFYYLIDYNDNRYEILITLDNEHKEKGKKNIEEIVNTFVFE